MTGGSFPAEPASLSSPTSLPFPTPHPPARPPLFFAHAPLPPLLPGPLLPSTPLFTPPQAIMNKNTASLHDCRIYVTLFPCNECAKLIIQARIAEVRHSSSMSRARLGV